MAHVLFWLSVLCAGLLVLVILFATGTIPTAKSASCHSNKGVDQSGVAHDDQSDVAHDVDSRDEKALVVQPETFFTTPVGTLYEPRSSNPDSAIQNIKYVRANVVRVAFCVNQLDYRGTEDQHYNYALLNEEILGNQSFIFVSWTARQHPGVVAKFAQRFPIYQYMDISHFNQLMKDHKIDVAYFLRGGAIEEWLPEKVPACIHFVFSADVKYGAAYAAISEYVSNNDVMIPVVHHVTLMNYVSESGNMREELNLPKDAVVIGRYGSSDTFTLPIARQAILKALDLRPNLYFLAMNTDHFGDHPRLLYLPQQIQMNQKKRFIQTCDGYLHGRIDAETFGLAIMEFAICGKPIFTFDYSTPEYLNKSSYHVTVLKQDLYGGDKWIFQTEEEAVQLLLHFDPSKDVSEEYKTKNIYFTKFHPEIVMQQWKRVFLDAALT